MASWYTYNDLFSLLCCGASLKGGDHGRPKLDVIGGQKIKKFNSGGVSCKSLKDSIGCQWLPDVSSKFSQTVEKLELAICVQCKESQINVGNKSLQLVMRRCDTVKEVAVSGQVLIHFGIEIGHGEEELPSVEKNVVNGGEVIVSFRTTSRQQEKQFKSSRQQN